MPSQAVIHFVGLVVWTMQSLGPDSTLRVNTSAAQPTNPATVVAIMPRVTGTETYSRAKAPARVATQATAVSARSAPAVHRMASDPPHSITLPTADTVEAHTAIIAFAPCDLLSSSGWEIKRLTDRLLYVELHGDAVTFRGDVSNPRANLDDASLLPHIGGSLQADYAPSGSKAGAAAVFNIPQGIVRTCMAQGTNDEGNSIHQRVDTYLFLNTTSTLTVDAAVDASPRQLVLTGSAIVYAADVPTAWIETVSTGTPHPPTGTLPHYDVYCRMNGTDANCQPPAGSDCATIAPPPVAGAAPSSPAGCHYCGELRITPGGKGNEPVFLMTSECSNTRYP